MYTHKGIEMLTFREYGTDIVVHTIDLRQVQMSIVVGFDNVPNAVARYGAQLGFNNVGWNSRGVINDMLWTAGVAVQNKPIDWRASYTMNITKNFEILFEDRLRYPHNVIGFDRIIGRKGVFEKRITDKSRAPRTVYARTPGGLLVIFTCEGRTVTQAGMTFREVWDFLVDHFDVTDAGNADGGGSTCAVNTALSTRSLITYYEKELRRVVSQTLFYADPLVSVPPPLSIGDQLNAHAIRLNDPDLANTLQELKRLFPEVYDV